MSKTPRNRRWSGASQEASHPVKRIELGPFPAPQTRAETELHNLGEVDSQPSLERPRVLLVDDDPELRRLGREQLEIAGFVVSEAGNHSDALPLIDSFEPDVVVLDVDMPGSDSFAVCSSIRTTPNGREIPVVLATAHDDLETIERCFDSGATDIVRRPIDWLVVSQRLRGITNLRNAERRIRRLAHFDGLTGLPNRVMLLDILGRNLLRDRRAGRYTAVLCLDIDRFGVVNASMGREAGDWLLRKFADRLRATLRRSDYVLRDADADRAGAVARPGSDQFITVLSDLDHPEGAARAAQRMLEALSKPFVVNEREVHLSASMGIAAQPDGRPDPVKLLQSAEIALHYAKQQGRGGFHFYDESMNDEVKHKLEMAEQLRKALNRRELSLCYQPLVDCRTRQILGVEALLRWHHPELGTVPPTEFIPIAEEMGIMPAIGDWVLSTACRQVREWTRAGLSSLRLSVNLSPCQLKEPGFAARVGEILKETHLDPSCLELELTERGVMLGNEATLECLRELKALGVGLAVDDFGTGNYSLGYLKLFPLDVLKIDRSFVDSIRTGAKHAGLVAGIIALAHRARLKVIAEGVETEEQLSFLQSEECDEVQGFLFSKPLVAEQIGELMG
jgi:diguanylate cyclase (GGDEF)-like protein